MDVPEPLLKPCEWFTPFSGDSIEDVLAITLENSQKQERCYYLNKSKIEFLQILKEQ